MQILYFGCGSETLDPSTVAIGQAVAAPDAPLKAGCKFAIFAPVTEG